MATDIASELKAITSQVTTFNTESEPIFALDSLLAILRQVKQSGLEGEDAQATINALPSIVNQLLTNKKFASDESIGKIGEALYEVIEMTPDAIGLPKFQECIQAISNLNKHFNKVSAQVSGKYPVYISAEPEEDPFKEWRLDLQEGDVLDAIKNDIDYDRLCWATAKVSDVFDDTYYLQFENELSVFDKTVPRNSMEIAPKGTYTADEGWRDELQEGSLIDAYDTAMTWYNSTVINVKEEIMPNGETYKSVLVGYRIYEPTGAKSDEIGMFRGWSDKYDEWLSVRSPRIALYKSLARNWPIPTPHYMEESVLDDSNDLVIVNENAKFVARPPVYGSAQMAKNLNKAYQNGVLDKILEMLSSTGDKWLGFTETVTLIQFLSKVYPYYHREYVKEIVPRMEQIVRRYFLQCPETILRQFKRNTLDSTIRAFEGLLKRIYTIPEKVALVDELSLQIALRCFKCPFLEQRIQGLKGILESVKNCRYTSWRAYTTARLVEWIRENNILEDIFGSEGHCQLMQRSGEIIRLLALERALTEEHLDLIWTATDKNDQEAKLNIYKVLGEVCTVLSAEFLDKILSKIDNIPPGKLVKEELELMAEITKYPLKAPLATANASEMLWKMCTSEEKYSPEIVEKALANYFIIMRGWDFKKKRLGVLVQCLEKISRNESSIQCIRVISKLLGSFQVHPTQNDPQTREIIVNTLVADHDFLQIFFDNLTQIKERGKDALASWEGDKEAFFEQILCERTSYIKHIQERLELLYQVLSFCSGAKLGMKHLNQLWDQFILQSLGISEKSAFLKWLNDITECQGQGKQIIEDDDINSFFHNKIADDNAEYSNITEEEFKVFQTFFFLVNLSQRKLSIIPKPLFKSAFGSTSKNSNRENREFEYQVLVPPLELDGMSSFRKMLFQGKDLAVLAKLLEMFHFLYDYISEALDGSLAQIRKEFADKCLSTLSEPDDALKKRSLLLLMFFMNECEKKGTGELRSHSAMLKGDIHNITVLNRVDYYPMRAKIPSKMDFKVYSNTTLWELRCLITPQAELLPNQFTLKRTLPSKEFSFSDNGKTLRDLRIRGSETFIITRNFVNIPQVPLTTDEGQLVPRTREIFTKWFYHFTEGKDLMNPDECANFTNACTGDHCKGGDDRMRSFFAKHDSNQDGFLTLDDFLEFYRSSSYEKPGVVWSNLQSYNYRNDLMNFEDLEEEKKVDLESIPVYFMSNEESIFQQIFQLLNNPELANISWNIITKLPTNSQIHQSVLELDIHWDELRNTSVHKLLYMLQIIEAIMEETEEESQQLKDQRRIWKRRFLETGNFQQLYQSIQQLTNLNTIFEKNCLASGLKILGFFIIAVFSTEHPEIFQTVELVRKSSIDQPVSEPVKEAPEPEVLGSTFTEQQMIIEQFIGVMTKEDEEVGTKYTSSEGFKEFVNEILQYNLTENIMKSIDFGELISKLIAIIGMTINQNEYESEDKNIIDCAIELWVGCLMHKNELMQAVYDAPVSVEEFTVKGLTFSKSLLVRKIFLGAIEQVCLKVIFPERKPLPFFLNLLIQKMPQGEVNAEESEYLQYFELLGKLVAYDIAEPTVNYDEFIDQIIAKLRDHPFTERRTTIYSDKVLVGLINVAEAILSNLPQLKQKSYISEFPQEAFQTLLFPPTKDFKSLTFDPSACQDAGVYEPPKCKTRESRAAAYKFLVTLTKGNQQMTNTALTLFSQVREKLDVISSWSYQPSASIRGSIGYAGILNPGCICYMNAPLQQLYMVPEFRKHIMLVDDGETPTNLAWLNGEEVDTSVKGYNIDDNFLHQLQRMFGFLNLTERVDYDPNGFAFAFKDYDGQPTNVVQQQDASEFLSLLFGRLESKTEKTPYKTLLQEIFGGKTVCQMVCSNCDYKRESIEDIYFLSVEVKHCKNLHESLGKYCAGDVINDFTCDNCQQKVDLKRSTILGHLPNILMIHLKRIVFDFDTFANKKINSYLEFPKNLNVEGYCRGAQDEPSESLQDFEYELVGVIVHTGIADAGHYYSFIRGRNPDGSPIYDKWFEFNDSTVRNFNIDDLEYECFGTDESKEFGPMPWGSSLKLSFKSAYMLVYEKTIKRQLSPFSLAGDSTTSTRPPEASEFLIPDSIFREIVADNEKFMFDRHVYSSEFFNFFKDLLENAKELGIGVGTSAMEFCTNVVAKAYNNLMLPDIGKVLIEILKANVRECEELVKDWLNAGLEPVAQILFNCSERSTRSAFADVYLQMLNILAEEDFSKDSTAVLFLEGLLSFLHEKCAKNWNRFEQYWNILLKFVQQKEAYLDYFIERDCIALFADFYLGPKSPLAPSGESRNAIGSKMWPPKFDMLIQVISMMVTQASMENRPGKFELSQGALACLYEIEFYDKALRNSYDGQSLAKIITHLAYNNEEFSKIVSRAIVSGLNEIEYQDIKSYYLVLESFLTIDDLFQQNRIEWVLGLPAICRSTVLDQNSYPCYGEAAIHSIDEDVFNYNSTLCFGHSAYITTDSVLTLMWKQSKRWDHYCLLSIKNLLEIALKSELLLNYLGSLPPPTYQHLRFLDWLANYLNNFQHQSRFGIQDGITSSTSQTLKNDVDKSQQNNAKQPAESNKPGEKGANDTKTELSLIDQTKQLFDEVMGRVHLAAPYYIISSTIDQKILEEQTKDEVRLTVTEYTTRFCESRPDGRLNAAIPEKKLYFEMKKRENLSMSVEDIGTEMVDIKKRVIFDSNDYIEGKHTRVSPTVTLEAPESQEEDEQTAPEEAHENTEMPVGQCLIRFEIWNRSHNNIRVVFEFKQQENANYRIPHTELIYEIPSFGTRDIATLIKFNPLEPWGEIDYDWRLEQPVTFNKEEDDKISDLAVYPIDDFLSDIGFTTLASDGDIVSCPACTFHNSSMAVLCEVCGSKLKQ